LENVVRELSKSIDGANVVAYKEMIRVIKFVLDTRITCLRLKPNLDDENWDLMVYSDSEWARDVENRISATTFLGSRFVGD
jgi:hypothetical protein